MKNITLYHNPRCSKSRQTLQLLREHDVEPEIIEYLQTPPSAAELTAVLGKLNLTAEKILRRSENEFKELNIAQLELSQAELIQIMVKHPKLIQRPILIVDNKAAIGRPPETVLEIL